MTAAVRRWLADRLRPARNADQSALVEALQEQASRDATRLFVQGHRARQRAAGLVGEDRAEWTGRADAFDEAARLVAGVECSLGGDV